jgi:hypothetical protein
MRGGDRQGAPVSLAQLRRGAAYVLHFAQDAGGARDDFLARGRGASQRAPGALEQLEAQLFLEHFQLPADAGLRGVQLPRGCGDVQTVFMHRHEIAKLLQFHADILDKVSPGLPGIRGELVQGSGPRHVRCLDDARQNR